MMLVGFGALVCGLAALVYVIAVRRGMPPEQPEDERAKSDRFLRDAPW